MKIQSQNFGEGFTFDEFPVYTVKPQEPVEPQQEQ